VYTISNIESEEIKASDIGPGGMCRLGTFQIENPLLYPFCLWITLENGGNLAYEKYKGFPAIGLKDMLLLYKNEAEAPIVKRFSDGSSNAGGHAYEVFFRQEDMQLVYEVELWGILSDRDKAVAGGAYVEKISFEIERMQVP
jgi:hypothetical protein